MVVSGMFVELCMLTAVEFLVMCYDLNVKSIFKKLNKIIIL